MSNTDRYNLSRKRKAELIDEVEDLQKHSHDYKVIVNNAPFIYSQKEIKSPCKGIQNRHT